MSRYGGPGIAAVPGFYNPPEIRQCQFSLSDFHHRAYDGAHHVPQKTVGFDGEDQLLPGILPMSIHDDTIVGFNIGVQFGKTGEVPVFKQYLAGFVHEADVGERVHFPRILAGKRILIFVNKILIGT